jgi:hypothetical protein
MGIFKPAWQGDNREKALKVIEKENDQAKLVNIALNAPLADVRMSAARKISGLKWNTRISAERQLVRGAADQMILTYIAKKYSTYDLENSISAAEKLTDKTLAQQIYVDIIKKYGYIASANGNPNIDSCIKAVGRIIDQSILVDIAKNSEDFKNTDARICLEALKFITAQSALADIVKSKINTVVREEAAKYIKDAIILDELADIISEIKGANNAYKAAQNKFIKEKNKQKDCTHEWVEQVGYDDALGHVKYIRCKKCGKYKDGMSSYIPG